MNYDLTQMKKIPSVMVIPFQEKPKPVIGNGVAEFATHVIAYDTNKTNETFNEVPVPDGTLDISAIFVLIVLSLIIIGTIVGNVLVCVAISMV